MKNKRKRIYNHEDLDNFSDDSEDEDNNPNSSLFLKRDRESQNGVSIPACSWIQLRFKRIVCPRLVSLMILHTIKD
jgi:hypothetical protein